MAGGKSAGQWKAPELFFSICGNKYRYISSKADGLSDDFDEVSKVNRTRLYSDWSYGTMTKDATDHNE